MPQINGECLPPKVPSGGAVAVSSGGAAGGAAAAAEEEKAEEKEEEKEVGFTFLHAFGISRLLTS